jgi:hypothetical protein
MVGCRLMARVFDDLAHLLGLSVSVKDVDDADC